MSRLTCRLNASRWTRVALAALAWLLAACAGLASAADVRSGFSVDVVVSRIPRPIQLALDPSGSLVVLSHGWRGDAAGEIYRLDLSGTVPVDAARTPRVVIPFADEPRKTVFGSLAVELRTGSLLLGEENGNRIYRVGLDERVEPVAVGLNHLLGGSTLTLDRQGRLVFLDFASPETHLRSESPLPPSLSWLTEEGYRGPLVYRIDLGEQRPLPRRADLLTPIVPRRGTTWAGREPLWRLIGVAVGPSGELVFLSSIGELFRLGADNELRVIARLPSGHYHRTNLTVGPDGSIYVSAGFHIRHIYRVSPAGAVSTVAAELGDPGGLVVDRAGALYVAETALHRIIRIAPAR